MGESYRLSTVPLLTDMSVLLIDGIVSFPISYHSIRFANGSHQSGR